METSSSQPEEEDEHLLLLKRIQQFESGNVHIQQQLSSLILHNELGYVNPKSLSISPHHSADPRRRIDDTPNPRRRIGAGPGSLIGSEFAHLQC